MNSGFVGARRIRRFTLGGSLFAGQRNDLPGHPPAPFLNNGAIRVDDDLGAVLIKGNLIGNSTNPAIISARGQAEPPATADLAIASLRVLGQVEHGLILAGYDRLGHAVNADAQIGTVTVGGDWTASNLAAGATAGFNGFFGDADDSKLSGVGIKDETLVVSRVTRVTIGGEVRGTPGPGGLTPDHYGIVAENIGSVTIRGDPLALTSGTGNDNIPAGDTGDFRVNEV
jgi:hypothetical protein